jgi:hypothetical protein
VSNRKERGREGRERGRMGGGRGREGGERKRGKGMEGWEGKREFILSKLVFYSRIYMYVYVYISFLLLSPLTTTHCYSTSPN